MTTEKDRSPLRRDQAELDYMTEALRTVKRLIDGKPGLEQQVAVSIMVYAGSAIERNTDLCATCVLREGIRATRQVEEKQKLKVLQ